MQCKNALPKGAILKSASCEYHVEEMLGQGSYGITYLASVWVVGSYNAIDTNRKVAIKEFFMGDINGRSKAGAVEGLTEGSLSYKYKQRFRKEAENIAKLSHPNIVKVIDFFEANDTFYYVMEYIEGENLHVHVNGKPLSVTEAIAIIKEVGKALTYMHEEKKMLHLDLKPGNIMRRRSDGHIFLIDFGLTKIYADDGKPETSTSIGLGTPGYAPLEQANSSVEKNSFSPTIDVYSLGATLLKLLTAEAIPSATEVLNDDELLDIIMSRHGIDESLKVAILHAMEPKAKERTSSVRQFISAIEISKPEKKQDEDETVYDEDRSGNVEIRSVIATYDNKNEDTRSNGKEEKYQEEDYDKSSICFFQEGLARVKGKNGKYGFVDRNGKLVILCQWEAANHFSEGMAAVMDRLNRWGYIDKKGQLVIACKWKNARTFSTNGIAKVQDWNENWIEIYKNGDQVKSYIEVTSKPSGARAIIDDIWRETTPKRFEIAPGRHKVQVVNGEDWSVHTQTVELIKGQTAYVFATLTQKSYIEVNSTMPIGAVYIDGNWRGVTKNTFEVTQGMHEVKVNIGVNWTEYIERVEVGQGETKYVFADHFEYLIPHLELIKNQAIEKNDNESTKGLRLAFICLVVVGLFIFLISLFVS